MRAHEFITKTGQQGRVATNGDYFYGDLVDTLKLQDADDLDGDKVIIQKITRVGGKKHNSNR